MSKWIELHAPTEKEQESLEKLIKAQTALTIAVERAKTISLIISEKQGQTLDR